MCGRNSLFVSATTLEERFDATIVFDDYRPRYNIAPAQPHPVITNETPSEVRECRWGLQSGSHGQTDRSYINARLETASDKPAFRNAWNSRPCLVPSTGFYEWQSTGRTKQPYRIYRAGDHPFAIGGLWEPPVSPSSLPTMTILTKEANELIESVHNRMPVLIPETAEHRWLTGTLAERKQLCTQDSFDDLEMYPISTRVNNPTVDSASLIEPLNSKQSGLDSFG